MRVSRALAFSVFLFLPALVLAQGTAVLSGRVLDRQGDAPIGLATIAVESPNAAAGSPPLGGALAAENGRFVIQGLAPGQYRVRITFPGYEVGFSRSWTGGTGSAALYHRDVSDAFLRIFAIDDSNPSYDIVNRIFENAGNFRQTGVQVTASQAIAGPWRMTGSVNGRSRSPARTTTPGT